MEIALAVQALIAHGASVNAKESWQDQTALMFAASENNAAAVKVLVEAGADMNLHSKVWNFPEYKYETNGMAVFQLPRGGWTALMFAARQNAKEAAAMLVDLKADLNAQDPDGTTALQLAILNVHYDLASVLLRKGANPNVQGQIKIVNAAFAGDSLPLGLQNGNGVLTLTSNRLEIEQFSGKVSGGHINPAVTMGIQHHARWRRFQTPIRSESFDHVFS